MKTLCKHIYMRYKYVYQSAFEEPIDYMKEHNRKQNGTLEGYLYRPDIRNDIKKLAQEANNRCIDGMESYYDYVSDSYRARVDMMHKGSDKVLYCIRQRHADPIDKESEEAIKATSEYQYAISQFCNKYGIQHSVEEGYAMSSDTKGKEQKEANNRSPIEVINDYYKEKGDDICIEPLNENGTIRDIKDLTDDERQTISYRLGYLLRAKYIHPSEDLGINTKVLQLIEGIDQNKKALLAISTKQDRDKHTDTATQLVKQTLSMNNQFKTYQELRDRIAFDEGIKVAQEYSKAALVFGANHDFHNELEACLETDNDLPTIYEVVLEPYDSSILGTYNTPKEQDKSIYDKLQALYNSLWG